MIKPTPTTPSFAVLNDQNFYEIMSASQGVSIVFFTKVGCSSCRAWRKLLAELKSSQPNIQLYEIDAQTSSALTQEYAIFHFPALFVFVDGVYHAPLQCEARVSNVLAAVTATISAPAREAP